jgi:rhodanese-related sulfurtransferase
MWRLGLCVFLIFCMSYFTKAFRPLVRQSRTGTRLMATEVRKMDIQKFGDIIKDSSARSLYQIVDVREADELARSRLSGDDIMHLPLSTSGEWTQDIEMGKILDSDKPVLCLCRAGARSAQLAGFLASKDFAEVYNVEGGMLAYYANVDNSVGQP